MLAGSTRLDLVLDRAGWMCSGRTLVPVVDGPTRRSKRRINEPESAARLDTLTRVRMRQGVENEPATPALRTTR
jgi:hypothetical protein